MNRTLQSRLWLLLLINLSACSAGNVTSRIRASDQQELTIYVPSFETTHLAPGMRVDVLSISASDAVADAPRVAQTIFQNSEVFLVRPGPHGNAALTILVPNSIPPIKLPANVCHISLRGAQDHGTGDVQPVKFKDLQITAPSPQY